MLLLSSYSPRTIADIRSARPYKPESNQDVVRRLAYKYGLPELEIRVLIAADDNRIDHVGRIRE